jgi:hypothetical protein
MPTQYLATTREYPTHQAKLIFGDPTRMRVLELLRALAGNAEHVAACCGIDT